MTDTNDTYEGWIILELMGHRRLAGHVTERVVAGVAMLQITIPGEPPITQLYAPTALYCMTPTTEEIARAVAEHNRPQPVHRWELPAPNIEHAMIGSVRSGPDYDDEEDDPYDMEDRLQRRMDEIGPPF